jgi:hypothetical protein
MMQNGAPGLRAPLVQSHKHRPSNTWHEPGERCHAQQTSFQKTNASQSSRNAIFTT